MRVQMKILRGYFKAARNETFWKRNWDTCVLMLKCMCKVELKSAAFDLKYDELEVWCIMICIILKGLLRNIKEKRKLI